MRDKRVKAKHEGKLSISEALKLAMNGGAFGKSNAQDNFMYDPIYTMRTTINCQLFISMFAEKIVLNIPECRILQINTDGITVMMKAQYRDLYEQLRQEWQQETEFELELQEYKKMVIRDVSNYLAVKPNGKCKFKGDFEIDKELYKNNSMLIVPKALYNYYVNGISPEQTLREANDIFDFCKSFRATKGWKTQIRYIKDAQEIRKISQKTQRYFLSKNGVALLKVHEDGREISVEAKKTVTLFNKAFYLNEFKDYNIDYQYYLKEIYKQILTINDGQLNMF